MAATPRIEIDLTQQTLTLFDADGGEIKQYLVSTATKGGGEFEPCEYTNACDSGLMCLNSDTAPTLCDPESVGCCIPACDLTDPVCPETTTCTPYYEEPVPGLDDVGVCATPS